VVLTACPASQQNVQQMAQTEFRILAKSILAPHSADSSLSGEVPNTDCVHAEAPCLDLPLLPGGAVERGGYVMLNKNQ
jgi:GTP cyclohydrolase FolE2